MDKLDKEALKYHSEGVPGKVEVTSSKDVSTDYALSLAYSPGVAAPCTEIAKDPLKAFDYTTRGNLVGVITNGTAVLGLGNIGPLASKPVMEGKGVLFKKFANINVFDIEVDTTDTEDFIKTVKNLEPTFGGINLEDIGAPQCFEIEERLKKEMAIPVFHDDQHGTAIITAAGLINACHLTKKKLSKIKVVFNGAGAAALSCAQLIIDLGVKKQNVLICDSKGVISKSRTDLNKYKEKFAVKTDRKKLADALKDADVFIGVSVGGAVTEKMIKTMAKEPIVFAMANPEPEIRPELVKKVRPDAIVATGRSDYPNQVNNVLGFPYIFRGALDVRATSITEGMKRAAAYAISELARESVPDEVSEAYQGKSFHFGKDYIIPKPFDQRVLLKVAPAVAEAAMKDKVAQTPIKNMKTYIEELEAFISAKQEFVRPIINKIKTKNRRSKKKARILFPEGNSRKVLKACEIIIEEDFATPVLMGNRKDIEAAAEKNELKKILDLEIIDPTQNENKLELTDGLISGASTSFSSAVKPILDIIGPKKDKVISGLNIFIKDGKQIFLADTAMKINPTAQELSQICLEAADVALTYNQEPKIAFLSFTNFMGGTGSPKKMQEAAEIVKAHRPNLELLMF